MTNQNQELAGLFHAMAGLLAAHGTNPYRIRAYRKAAESLLELTEDVTEIARRGDLQSIPGIGKDLSAKIQEYVSSGRIQAYEELKTPIPDEVKAWTNLPGFSEHLVHDLYFRLGIQSLPDLERMVRSHMLRTVPGMAERTEEILAAIQIKLLN
ncbi:MAG: histidinol-phosphatase [Nitrospirales bacterium]